MKKVSWSVRMMAVAAMCACGMTPPAQGAPPMMAGPAATSPALSPEVRDLLQMLHDRKNTLKDFTAKIDYSVYHPISDDESGKIGTVDYIVDPSKGPIFTVDFTDNTVDRVPKAKYHQQVIFDGVSVTTKDFVSKVITHSVVLPDGAKPGDAVTLGGPLTLPIGLDPEDVARTFDVTIVPNPKGVTGDVVTLRLIPKPGGKFDFRQMDVLVDKKQQLPMQLVQTAKNKDVTTIRLTEIMPNTGKAKMADASTPAGWTEQVLNPEKAPVK